MNPLARNQVISLLLAFPIFPFISRRLSAPEARKTSHHTFAYCAVQELPFSCFYLSIFYLVNGARLKQDCGTQIYVLPSQSIRCLDIHLWYMPTQRGGRQFSTASSNSLKPKMEFGFHVLQVQIDIDILLAI